MTFQVQDNRSETQDRRPLPTSLLAGQTAINYNNQSPGLFFNTSTGALVKAGPVAMSPTPPTLETGGHNSYSVGEMWLDTTGNHLKIWNGSEWTTVVGTASNLFIPPTSATGLPSGALWNNSGTLSIAP